MHQYISRTLINHVSQYEGFDFLMELGKDYNELEFFLAGGVVRNAILLKDNWVPKDIDIFVSGPGFNDFKKRVSKFGVARSTPFGSLRWALEFNSSINFDIVHFEEMAVLNKPPKTINELLGQFDITINALAVNLKDREFFNPIGGVSDVENKIIRAIRFDFKDENISEECEISPLTTLWFRILHFASKYKFRIEKDTLDWVWQNSFRFEEYPIFEKYFFSPNLESVKKYKILH